MTEKIVQYLLRLLCITVGVATLVTPSDPPPCECSNSQFVLHSGQTLIIEHNSSPSILHSGFNPDDYRQEIVAEAYQLGGLEFVALLECENGLRTIDRTGDQGQSHGLCQLNQRWHREVYDGRRSSREFQLSVCFQKRKTGTKFY